MTEFTIIAIGKVGHQIGTCRDPNRARELFLGCIEPEKEYFTVALYQDGDLADIVTRPAPFIPLRIKP